MQKDVGTVSPEQSSQGKRQHVVEVCNFVDAGTSIALLAQAREDFHEQTAIETVIAGRGARAEFPFPTASTQGTCLGVRPQVCQPHRPDNNAFVERFHRAYGQECLQVHQPGTLQEVREVTEAFLQHCNYGYSLSRWWIIQSPLLLA